MGQGSETAKGAMGGATTGATIGSLGGPMGTAIGAGAGAIIGGGMAWWDSRNKKKNKYNPNQANYNLPGFHGMTSDYNQALAAGAPQSGMSSFRGDQARLARMLAAQASGHAEAPGQRLARMEAQAMADRGAAQQMAMAQGGRGGMGALAGRNAAMNAAQIQSRAGQQSAMGGLAAQMGAQQQLSGVLAGARGQDISQSQFNANLQFQNQAEMMRQRLMAAQMQQQGMMGYDAAKGGKWAVQQGQPSTGDQLMGMGIGAVNAYTGMKSAGIIGGGGGGGNSSWGGNDSNVTPWGSPRD